MIMVEIGALEEVAQEVNMIWERSNHYISIQHMLNESANSLYIQLVTSSSLVGLKTGILLNHILLKDHTILND